LTSEIQTQGEEEMKPTQAAAFLVHAKEHGLTYAVVLLLAQQLGLLNELAGIAGGMC
jgi:hypothetical protein